ncbi:MAG: Mur ligase family protein [Planctomycetota bacterium]|jgi:dihydrofolate synthase/folylpolyglutamate synthase|nr:Mur ligase family protein [Planctomycetota bacterium]MDP6761243.1 Mur ligase family protein [Planctomycetota bacterium]MDP6988383.1 Mur ligase family protein [Planctomycetota bacterium]
MSSQTEHQGAALRAALARLDELVDWERRDRSGGMERSLAPIRDVLARLGDPASAWRAVHVAGTKGKGSVCALIAEGLKRAGLRAGIYASPHVERVTERVRVDGAEVAEDRLAAALDEAWRAREAAAAEGGAGAETTWFDLMTAAAFLVLRDEGVDWGVIECGIGGRLDSTNALSGDVAVLTHLDLEHTATLGTTLAAIAAEKGAILTPQTTLVTTAVEPEAAAVLEDIVAERRGRWVRVEATGSFAVRNQALASAALDTLGAGGAVGSDGVPLSGALLDEAACRAARLPGRVERFFGEGCPVVLDAAHVVSSVEGLLGELAADERLEGPPQLVLALGRDKDHARVLKALAGRVDRCFVTSASGGPLLGARELAALAVAAGLETEACEHPRAALARARSAAAGGGWVLVIGSFYLAGELRGLLGAPDSQPTPPTPC